MRLCNIDVLQSDIDGTLFYRNSTQKVVDSTHWETIFHNRCLGRVYKGFPVYDAVFRLQIWWGIASWSEMLNFVSGAPFSGYEHSPILPLMYGMAYKIKKISVLTFPTRALNYTAYATGASGWVRVLEKCAAGKPNAKCWKLVECDKLRMTLYKDVHLGGSVKQPNVILQNRFNRLTIHGARKFFVRQELFQIILSRLDSKDVNIALLRLAKRCRWNDTVMLHHYSLCNQEWLSILANNAVSKSQKQKLLWNFIEGQTMIQVLSELDS